ncbi:hypothetical protein P153DRAFT_360974 [Dothidotthia symphoricarpi CBS 119687]|uniref:Uncharacterized protein n=1 Tax=Dothidotthia symphoricarpi CBS 119687 TaxID=1392245 RepID=A0A6A6A2J9_9PLEO|nr:uncharacterized protein P153DRAFT_360974 [Dothidotthia symphoricarpi CBS 119687]KAF2124801.1 hypothetical protein P153DRAFT_360974 [Dothidotthia symphoricarpi CBS 119687]
MQANAQGVLCLDPNTANAKSKANAIRKGCGHANSSDATGWSGEGGQVASGTDGETRRLCNSQLSSLPKAHELIAVSRRSWAKHAAMACLSLGRHLECTQSKQTLLPEWPVARSTLRTFLRPSDGGNVVGEPCHSVRTETRRHLTGAGHTTFRCPPKPKSHVNEPKRRAHVYFQNPRANRRYWMTEAGGNGRHHRVPAELQRAIIDPDAAAIADARHHKSPRVAGAMLSPSVAGSTESPDLATDTDTDTDVNRLSIVRARCLTASQMLPQIPASGHVPAATMAASANALGMRSAVECLRSDSPLSASELCELAPDDGDDDDGYANPLQRA